MNCREIEMLIYTYEECSEEEQQVVDWHIQECSGCRELLQAAQQQRALLKKASTAESAIQDPQQLTNRIMDDIGKEGSIVELAPDMFRFIRYAAVAASLLLVVFFTYETSFRSGIKTEPGFSYTKQVAEASAQMDTQSFFTHRRKKEQPASIAPLAVKIRCARQCQTSTNEEACNNCKKRYTQIPQEL